MSLISACYNYLCCFWQFLELNSIRPCSFSLYRQKSPEHSPSALQKTVIQVWNYSHTTSCHINTNLTIFYKKGTGLNEKSWMEPYHISDQWYMSRLVINPEPWSQTQTYIHTTQPSTYASDSSTSMWLHSSFHNLTDEHETSWTVRVGNNMCLPFCFPLASFIYRMLLRCWGSLDIPPFMLWNMTNGIMHRTLERVHMHKCRADN